MGYSTRYTTEGECVMGYSTRYSLRWEAVTWKPAPLCNHAKSATAKFCETCGKPATRSLDDVVAAYIADHEDEEIGFALDRDGSTTDSCKWYDHLDDLAQMSREIPGVLFHLSGEGEEAGDIWDAFALNGATQKHKVKIVRVTAPHAWPPSGGEEGPK